MPSRLNIQRFLPKIRWQRKIQTNTLSKHSQPLRSEGAELPARGKLRSALIADFAKAQQQTEAGSEQPVRQQRQAKAS
jgi:hypothetical protein